MNKTAKHIITGLLATTICITNLVTTITADAVEKNSIGKVQETKYEIYPNPQDVKYELGEFKIGDKVNIVYEKGIDVYTRNKLETILKDHKITFEIGETVEDGITNILIGINESGGFVDKYFNDKVKHEEKFFEKIDSHIINVNNNVLGVLGSDTDSAFYGITTLKHIFNQLQEKVIRNFRIDDYAEVEYRGFIEGYYGNPWSNEDRAELMKYGGDYKLNQYIFAPKDDKYHNSKWRELYPEEDLKAIQKLAKAGNESKNRYVYALHPFMHNAMRFDTEENYQADLDTIKKKFTQLLKADVRQFGILADDAGVPPQGPTTYNKLLGDVTKWLEEQQKTYPDLKTDLVFCPNDYMGNGSSEQLKELNKAGDNVSIVMTGGRIWGEVNQSFATNFMNNIATPGNPGRAPYFWINWPCSDNSKQHLIMGGNDKFLHPGVDPNTIDGIVLNPMQQAEANKSSLFAVADYSWNIWDNKEEADQNWEDSFKYMDHGTAEETNSSLALKEISKHMINQNMDGRVVKLEESIELGPKINAFKEKYKKGESIKNEGNLLIKEFEDLKNAAKYYKENPGNPRTRDQIKYWLDCWEDTTESIINYLKAAISIEEGKNDEVWTYYSNGQAAFEKSKTYGFHYVDHTEYAEVGVQHIVPFIKFMGEDLSSVVGAIVDPSKVITKFVTNREDTQEGNISNVLDKDSGTEIVFKNPNSINKGTYVGLEFSTKIDLNDVHFSMGTNSNKNDTFSKAKVEYTEDGKNWIELSDEVYTNPQEIKLENLNVKAKAIRLIATEAKGNTWLGVRDITVNKGKEETLEKYVGVPSVSDNIGIRSGDIKNIVDGNVASGVSFSKNPYVNPGRDTTPENAWVQLEFEDVKDLGEIKFVQAEGDKLDDAELEYTVDGENWASLGNFKGKSIIEYNASGSGLKAKAIRVRNNKETAKWWEVREFTAIEPGKIDTSTPITKGIIRSNSWSVYNGNENNLIDGNENSDVWYKTGAGDITKVGDFIGLDLGRIADIGEVKFVVGREGSGDKWTDYKLEYSVDNTNWTTFKEYRGKDSGKDIVQEDLSGIQARYVRLTNMKELNKWVIFSEMDVKENKSLPSTKNIYTNTKLNIKSIYSHEMTKLQPMKNITLNKDEFIGLKLDRIKSISKINYEVSNENGLKLQSSLNGQEWFDVNTKTELKDARYVRIIQTAEKGTFDLNKLEVYSNEIYGPSLIKAYTSVNMPAEKVFNGDLNTRVQFERAPRKNDEIVYDLGQVRKIDNLKYTVLDTEWDYIRDAKIQISMDGENWTDAITIGDGVENTQADDLKPADAGIGYKHGSVSGGKVPISHSYVEGANLNTQGRYLRVLFTANYNHKWTVINELIINDGEYVREVNNPTFISNPIEVKEYSPENLIDGNLNTAYRPDTKNGTIKKGTLTYRISEKNDIKKINIIQNGNAISNAKVSVRTGYDKAGNGIWNEIGVLNKSLTEILNPKFKNIYEIKIDWEGVAPTIYEIITINNYELPDSSKLQVEYDRLKETSEEKYTIDSFKNFKTALDMAKKTLDNNNSTQSEIDNALNKLVETEKALKIKAADLVEFNKFIEEANAIVEGNYTVETFKPFKEKLNVANEMKKNIGNYTQEEVNKILGELKDLKEKLVVQINKTELKALVESCNYKQEDYLEEGFNEYAKQLEEAKKVLEDTDVTQEKVNLAKTNLEEAIKKLKAKATNLEEFNKILEEFNKISEEDYTEGTFKPFKEKLNVANEMKKNIDRYTQEQVDSIVKELKELKEKLKAKTNIIALKDLIESCKYKEEDNTKKSFEEYSKTLLEAKEVLKNAEDELQENIDKAKEKLEQAIESLVSIERLKEKIKEAEENLGEEAYSKEIWESYVKLLDEAKVILNKEDATKEEVLKAEEQAIDARLMLVQNIREEVSNVIKEAEKIKNTDNKYSKYSFERLTKEIEKAKELLEVENSTELQFKEGIKAIEKAKEELIDISKLNQEIKIAEEKINKENNYTEGSVNKVKKAITMAKKALEDKELTKELVEEKIQEIKEAIEGLMEKPINPPVEPGKPDTGKPDTGKPDTGKPDTGKPDTGKPDTGKPDTGKPDTGKPDTGKPDTGKPDSKPSAGKPENTIDTGDQGILAFSLTGIVALIGAIFLKKRK